MNNLLEILLAIKAAYSESPKNYQSNRLSVWGFRALFMSVYLKNVPILFNVHPKANRKRYLRPI